jgi:hypothetical protein
MLPGTPRRASVNFKGVLNVNGNRTVNSVFLLDGVDNISYSNSFRSNALAAPKPVRKRNQFGSAVGGPLVRNRTFWFGDYEGLREREGVPRVRLVPTAAEKTGLFSAAVVDPLATGRPEFSQNAAGQWVIPQSRWNPVGAAIVKLSPDPNVPGPRERASRVCNQFVCASHVRFQAKRPNG